MWVLILPVLPHDFTPGPLCGVVAMPWCSHDSGGSGVFLSSVSGSQSGGAFQIAREMG